MKFSKEKSENLCSVFIQCVMMTTKFVSSVNQKKIKIAKVINKNKIRSLKLISQIHIEILYFSKYSLKGNQICLVRAPRPLTSRFILFRHWKKRLINETVQFLWKFLVWIFHIVLCQANNVKETVYSIAHKQKIIFKNSILGGLLIATLKKHLYEI